MNKPRLSSVAFLALLGIFGCFLWLRPSAPNTGTSAVSVQAVSLPIGTLPLSTVFVATATNKKGIEVTPTIPRSNKAAAISIGNLLADSSLDNKAIMAGLSKMTLDADRGIEERTEAMGHLLNLSVEDPTTVLLPLVGDARLPDILCSQILDDALNAPPAWQAEACLSVLAHREGKEIHVRAHDHLTFLIGTDYGDNLVEWTKAIALAKEKPKGTS